MPTASITAGSSERRNGLVAFSRPMIVGSVGLLSGAQPLDLGHALAKRGVCRIDGDGEFRVGERIFVAAIELCLVGELAQAFQRIPHHGVVALDHPPAAQRKDRVADEDEILVGQRIGDVVEGVARRLDDADIGARPVEAVAVGDRAAVHAGLGGALCRADHLAIVGGLQRGDTLDVVEVLVGDEDMREPPAARLQLLDDRIGVGRVDRGGGAASGFVQEHAEIVGAGTELGHVELDHPSAS